MNTTDDLLISTDTPLRHIGGRGFLTKSHESNKKYDGNLDSFFFSFCSQRFTSVLYHDDDLTSDSHESQNTVSRLQNTELSRSVRWDYVISTYGSLTPIYQICRILICPYVNYSLILISFLKRNVLNDKIVIAKALNVENSDHLNSPSHVRSCLARTVRALEAQQIRRKPHSTWRSS